MATFFRSCGLWDGQEDHPGLLPSPCWASLNYTPLLHNGTGPCQLQVYFTRGPHTNGVIVDLCDWFITGCLQQCFPSRVELTATLPLSPSLFFFYRLCSRGLRGRTPSPSGSLAARRFACSPERSVHNPLFSIPHYLLLPPPFRCMSPLSRENGRCYLLEKQPSAGSGAEVRLKSDHHLSSK